MSCTTLPCPALHTNPGIPWLRQETLRSQRADLTQALLASLADRVNYTTWEMAVTVFQPPTGRDA